MRRAIRVLQYNSRLVPHGIRLLVSGAELGTTGVGLILFVVLLFNAEIGGRVVTAWEGLPRQLALIPLVALILWGVMDANYRRFEGFRAYLQDRSEVERADALRTLLWRGKARSGLQQLERPAAEDHAYAAQSRSQYDEWIEVVNGWVTDEQRRRLDAPIESLEGMAHYLRPAELMRIKVERLNRIVDELNQA